MDNLEFERQLAELQCGQLRLEPPGENGLSEFSFGWLQDVKRYIAALESGYRVVCEDRDGYAARERQQDQVMNSGVSTSLRRLLANQWSDKAALGYAAIALRMAHILPGKAVEVLEAMEDVMASTQRCEAEDALMMIKAARMDDWGRTNPPPCGDPPPLDRGGFDGGEAQA